MHPAFDKKRLGLLAILLAFSLFSASCNHEEQSQEEQPDAEDYELIEQKINKLEERIDSLEKTVNNPVYRNENFGFSFRLPKEVHVEVRESILIIWKATDYERREDLYDAVPLIVMAKDNPDELSVQEWVSTSYSNQLEGEVSKQIVGKQEGIRFDYLGKNTYTSVAVPHPRLQKMITITWDNINLEYKELFESMVKNLTFGQ